LSSNFPKQIVRLIYQTYMLMPTLRDLDLRSHSQAEYRMRIKWQSKQKHPNEGCQNNSIALTTKII